ncbi:MAG: hypothetical protein FWD41_01605 [Actinomycetia bacterium]|nr:hypothetical protein [Actinomycetes bacterium]
MRELSTILVFILNSTWGIIQSLMGLIRFFMYWRHPHYRYEASIVTVGASSKRSQSKGGLSLGSFIFISSDMKPEDIPRSRLVRHEYGHVLQSVALGPLFLPLVGIPSFIWAQYFSDWRKRNGVNYYTFYTERWADNWGESKLQQS